ncbi:MAG TPA: helix-hairpin-helix domain-containing protein, partial [Bacteroidota bacterium]|nr:helix-hairpin-helix domain-containing protein [Bacteroidota bacterium]
GLLRCCLLTITALFLVAKPGSPAISQTLIPVGIPADSAAFREIDDAVAEHATDEAGEELFEELSWLTDHPFDLNTVSAEELLRIPGVLPADVDAFTKSRRRAGRFTSVEQLRRIDVAGRRLHFLLAPFVRVHVPGGLSARARSRWLWRRSGEDADAADPQPGPMSQEHHRMDFRLWGGITGGADLHRDAGEPYRYAFLSGSLRIPVVPGLDDLLVGDYRATAAFGLVFGSARRSAYGVLREQPIESRVEPYHGSSGRNLLRGLALTKTMRFRSGTFTLRAFLSRVPLSASLDSAGRITSIDETSLFASESSIRTRHNAAETAGALRGTYTATQGFSIGVTILRAFLSRPVAGETPYQRPQASGVVGIDGRLESGALCLSGECASGGNGSAVAGRVGVELSPRTSVELILWRYGPGYWCSTSGGVSSGSEVRNDAGVRASWMGRISGGVTYSGYLQHWRRPWRTYMDPSPPSGVEGGMSVSLRPAPRIVCEGRYAYSRSEHSESFARVDGHHDVEMTTGTRNHVRCSVDIALGRLAGLRSRIDWVHVAGAGAEDGAKGWALAQDIRFGWEGFPRVSARVMIVETDSYAARLYIQERDVEGAYTNPPLSGSTIRWDILLRQAIAGSLAVSAKYGSSAAASGAFVQAPSTTLTVQIDFLTEQE